MSTTTTTAASMPTTPSSDVRLATVTALAAPGVPVQSVPPATGDDPLLDDIIEFRDRAGRHTAKVPEELADLNALLARVQDAWAAVVAERRAAERSPHWLED